MLIRYVLCNFGDGPLGMIAKEYKPYQVSMNPLGNPSTSDFNHVLNEANFLREHRRSSASSSSSSNVNHPTDDDPEKNRYEIIRLRAEVVHLKNEQELHLKKIDKLQKENIELTYQKNYLSKRLQENTSNSKKLGQETTNAYNETRESLRSAWNWNYVSMAAAAAGFITGIVAVSLFIAQIFGAI
jgi:hypothetical protein